MRKAVGVVVILLVMFGIAWSGQAETEVLMGGDTIVDATMIDRWGQDIRCGGECRWNDGKFTKCFSFQARQTGTIGVCISDGDYHTIEILNSQSQTVAQGKTDNNKLIFTLDVYQEETYWIKLEGRGYGFNQGLISISLCDERSHKPGQRPTVQDATCTSEGCKYYACMLCGLPSNQVTLPALGHDPEEWKTTTEATCEQDGLRVQQCKRCGEILEQRSVPATGHAPATAKVTLESDCMTNGILSTYCRKCNTLLSTEEMPLSDHKPGVMMNVMNASCTTAGRNEQHCTVCNALLASEEVPALGHRSSEWMIIREAACLQMGLQEKKCLTCGETLDHQQLNALEHHYTEWEIITEATRSQEGEKVRYCTNCGDRESETIPKKKLLGIF